MRKYFKCKFLVSLLLGAGLVSCSKMDATYKDFAVPNGIQYIGKADSANVLSGRERVEITWLRGTDPKTTRAVIYWNNGADSAIVPILQLGPDDKVSVIIDSLPENSYSFSIYTLDDEGHSSVGVNASGNSYGDLYESSLLIRPVNQVKSNGSNAVITWFPSSDTTSFTSEISYTDAAGNEIRVYTGKDADTTILENYVAGTSFIYRSLYKPDVYCLDTFYTSYDTVKVKKPPVEYAKEGWTATASSEDARTGRVAAQAIDGKLSTMWFSGVAAGRTYPHTLTVDMGKETGPVYGFSFVQRAAIPIMNVEIKVSGDGSSWKSAGIYTLSKTGDVQYIDFPEPESFRYFKVICLQGWLNDPNASIMEVGLYKR